MIVGFTGTRVTLTPKQRNSLYKLLSGQVIEEFHHGSCVGADEEAHEIINVYWDDLDIEVHTHPPLSQRKRAYVDGDVIYEEKNYRERNQDIVDASDILIACPGAMQEVLRSGTWMTVRMARKKGIPIYIVWPNGRVEKERYV